jgi:hypothetical protein
MSKINQVIKLRIVFWCLLLSVLINFKLGNINMKSDVKVIIV